MGKELEKLWKSEDYWAIWFAVILVLGIFFGGITIGAEGREVGLEPARRLPGDRCCPRSPCWGWASGCCWPSAWPS